MPARKLLLKKYFVLFFRSRAGIYVEEKKEDSGPVLSEEIPPREAGDGHEEPDSILNDTADIAGN